MNAIVVRHGETHDGQAQILYEIDGSTPPARFLVRVVDAAKPLFFGINLSVPNFGVGQILAESIYSDMDCLSKTIKAIERTVQHD